MFCAWKNEPTGKFKVSMSELQDQIIISILHVYEFDMINSTVFSLSTWEHETGYSTGCSYRSVDLDMKSLYLFYFKLERNLSEVLI